MIRPFINNEDRGKYNPRKLENIHHIFPTSEWGTNDERNKIRLYTNIHDAWHTITGTMLIKEALKQIISIHAPALSTEFKRELIKTLQEEDLDYYYKNGIYHKR